MMESVLAEFTEGLGFSSLSFRPGQPILFEMERSGDLTLLFSDDRVLLGLTRQGEAYHMPSPGKVLAACHYRATGGRPLSARLIEGRKVALSVTMQASEATSAALSSTLDFLVETMDRLWSE